MSFANPIGQEDFCPLLGKAVTVVTRLITETIAKNELVFVMDGEADGETESHRTPPEKVALLEQLKVDWENLLSAFTRVLYLEEDFQACRPDATGDQFHSADTLLSAMFTGLELKIGEDGEWLRALDQDVMAILLAMNHVSLWWKAVFDMNLNLSQGDPAQSDKCSIWEQSIDPKAHTSPVSLGQMSTQALRSILHFASDENSDLRRLLITATVGDDENPTYTNLLEFSGQFTSRLSQVSSNPDANPEESSHLPQIKFSLDTL